MTQTLLHVVCPHCGSVNRMPRERLAAGGQCGRCHRHLFDGKPVAVDSVGFGRHVGQSDIPVVVDFWAAWCGPCRAMAPVYEKVARELEPSVRFLKVDTEAHPDIAARFGIRGIPTMILFRGGAPVAQQVGAVAEPALRSWIQQHAG